MQFLFNHKYGVVKTTKTICHHEWPLNEFVSNDGQQLQLSFQTFWVKIIF